MTTPPAAGPQADAVRAAARRRLALLGVGAAVAGVAAAAVVLAAPRRRAKTPPRARPAPRGEQQQWTARRAAAAASLALAGAYGLRGVWRVWRLLSDPGDRTLLLLDDDDDDDDDGDDGAVPAADVAGADTAAALARCGASDDLADLAGAGVIVAVDCAARVRRLLAEAEEAIKGGGGGAAAAPWWRGPYRSPPPTLAVPGTVVLVGTAHLSPASARDAARAIERLCPHVVFLELCRERAPMLSRAVVDEEGVLPAPLLPRPSAAAGDADEEEEEDDDAIIREARAVVQALGLGPDEGDDDAAKSSAGRKKKQKKQRRRRFCEAARTGGSGLAALRALLAALYARLEAQLGVTAGAEFVAARLATEDLSREGALCSEAPELWERVAGLKRARRRQAAAAAAEATAAAAAAAAPTTPPASGGQPLAARRALLARLALCQPVVTLGDRPVRDTLGAIWAALATPRRRVAFALHVLRAAFSLDGGGDAAAALVESLKRNDVLAALVDELRCDFPELVGPLLRDRDVVMAANAWAAGARARARLAEADARARHRAAHEAEMAAWEGEGRGAAAAGGKEKKDGGDEGDDDDDDAARQGAAGDQGGRERRQQRAPVPPPAFRPLAPWQVQKLLSELDGGTAAAAPDGAAAAAAAASLAGAPLSPPEVVAIVGKGHVRGMVRALHRTCEAFAERVLAQRCALEQVRRAQQEEERQQQQQQQEERSAPWGGETAAAARESAAAC
jgi:pheromone shutdown protein TraB